METERGWGEDTVGLGRRREEPTREEAPRPRRRLPMPSTRALAAVAATVVALVGLVVVLGGGSDSGPAPIRVVADPAPPIVTPPPSAPSPRRKLRAMVPDPALKRPPKGQLEQREREPKASGPAHEQAAPAAEVPAPSAAAPAAAATPPATSQPTPPAVEFGL